MSLGGEGEGVGVVVDGFIPPSDPTLTPGGPLPPASAFLTLALVSPIRPSCDCFALSDVSTLRYFILFLISCGLICRETHAERPCPLIQQSGRGSALISPQTSPPPIHPPLSNRISTVFGPQCLSSNTGRGFGRGGGGGGGGCGRISI